MIVSTVLRCGAPVLLIAIVCSLTALAGDPPPKAAISSPPLPRYPWDTDEDYAIRQKLQQKLPDVDFHEITFEQAIERLRALSGVDIYVAWVALEAASIEKDVAVTIKARTPRLADVLERLLDEVSAGEVELAYDIAGGAIIISTKEDLSRHTITISHDCSDLVLAEETDLAKYIHRICQEIGDQRGREVWTDAAQTERLIRQVIQDSRQLLQEEIYVAICASIEPESWREAGGNVGAMTWVGPRLVITQTRPAQVQIAELLAKLRDQRDHPPPKARWP